MGVISVSYFLIRQPHFATDLREGAKTIEGFQPVRGPSRRFCSAYLLTVIVVLSNGLKSLVQVGHRRRYGVPLCHARGDGRPGVTLYLGGRRYPVDDAGGTGGMSEKAGTGLAVACIAIARTYRW